MPEDCKWRFPQLWGQFLTSHRQIVELRMCALSNHLREKPNWWEEVNDEVIVEKWKEEALRREEETLQRKDEAQRRQEEAYRLEEEAYQRGEEVLQQEEEVPQQEGEALQRELPWRKLTPTMVKSHYI